MLRPLAQPAALAAPAARAALLSGQLPLWQHSVAPAAKVALAAPEALAVWNHRPTSQRPRAQRVALLVAQAVQAELASRQLQLEQHRVALAAQAALASRQLQLERHPGAPAVLAV